MDFSSFFFITPILLFAFLGFESISSLYTIVKNPRKNVFLGGMIGVACVSFLYVAFSSSVIGSIAPNYFSGPANQSLAQVIANAFSGARILPKVIYFGGVFAIIGTLHSMIWSVSVLLSDVFKKSKALKIEVSEKSSAIIAGLWIILSSVLLTRESILQTAVFLIASSYILSIIALFYEKEHRWLNRVICIIGVLGGVLMVFFSLYSLVRIYL